MKSFPISKSSVDDQKPSTFNTIRLKNLHLSLGNGRKAADVRVKRNCNKTDFLNDNSASKATPHALDAEELLQLYSLFSEFSENFSQSAVLKKVKHILIDFLGVEQFLLLLQDQKSGEFTPAAAGGINISILLRQRKLMKPGNGFAYSGNYSAPETLLFKGVFPPYGDLIIEPIGDEKNRIAGYLAIYCKSGDEFNGKKRHFLTKLNVHLSHILARINDFQQIQQQSITDSLTQIPNRRFFDSQLKLEIERSSRYNHPLTLLMIDIDHFKRYNDRYGHPIGDVALKNVVRCLRSILREGDFLARYGGEEFMVILPEADKTQGMNVAEKLRLAVQAFAETAAEQQGRQKLTISIGVASLPENSTNGDALIEMVDQALYWAKAQGRNCTADYTLIQFEGKCKAQNDSNTVERGAEIS